MEFKSIMHVSFHTEQFDLMRDFYENKMGFKPKMIIRFKEYANSTKEYYKDMAKEHGEEICIMYFEAAPGQFIELFPKRPGMKEHEIWHERVGYSHFSLLVDDIFKTREELVNVGIGIDIEPNIGNSHTWQMWIHDPDGNRIEVMQYTPESFQITGKY